MASTPRQSDDLLDPQDVFRKTMGMEWEDLYNTRLARGWSLGLAQELKFLQALIRLAHPAMVGRLRRYWRQHQAGHGRLADTQFQSAHV